MKRLVVLMVVLLAGGLLSAPGQAQTDKFLGKSAAEWQKQLGNKDATARTNAAFALGKMGNDAFQTLPALVELLRKDEKACVRDAAALAVGRIAKRGTAGKDAINALCSALTGDLDYAVKRSAAVALGHCATDVPEVRSALEKALDDDPRNGADKGLKQNVAWALGEVCVSAEKPPVASMRKALADGDKLVKRDAANAIAKLQAKDAARAAVPDLVACVGHDYLELRKSACFALVELITAADTEALRVLSGVCNNNREDVEIRRNAALALSNVGGEKAKAAVPVLRDMLRSNDLLDKRRAANHFRKMGDDGLAAQDDLIQALKHDDEQLRTNAAFALGGLKSKAAVPALTDRIADDKEKERVRVVGCVALQAIGVCDEAKAAAPRLIDVLDNPKQPVGVRERTLWALRVHSGGLQDYPKLFTVMTKILVEPGLKTALSSTGQHSGKMLRYDCAFLLSVFKNVEAPEEVLPVLQDFVYDDKVRIYTGLGGGGGGGTKKEGTSGGTVKVEELGDSDGRMMALKALGQLTYDRVKTHPQILTQLQKMRTGGAGFDADIQKEAGKLLSDWGK